MSIATEPVAVPDELDIVLGTTPDDRSAARRLWRDLEPGDEVCLTLNPSLGRAQLESTQSIPQPTSWPTCPECQSHEIATVYPDARTPVADGVLCLDCLATWGEKEEEQQREEEAEADLSATDLLLDAVRSGATKTEALQTAYEACRDAGQWRPRDDFQHAWRALEAGGKIVKSGRRWVELSPEMVAPKPDWDATEPEAPTKQELDPGAAILTAVPGRTKGEALAEAHRALTEAGRPTVKAELDAVWESLVAGGRIVKSGRRWEVVLEPCPTTACCACGATVYTCEGCEQHQDGCELHDGRWVCSDACWEMTPAPPEKAPAVEAPVAEPKDPHAALKRFVRAILDLKQQKKEIDAEIKDQFESAELYGLDKKALKETIRVLDMDGYVERYELVNLYLLRLGHHQLRLPFETEPAPAQAPSPSPAEPQAQPEEQAAVAGDASTDEPAQVEVASEASEALADEPETEETAPAQKDAA